MKPITEFPPYMDVVLHELELLGFPQYTATAVMLGVPETSIAEYISLMTKASFIADETQHDCAVRIHRMFVVTFENAMLDVIMKHIEFPSE